MSKTHSKISRPSGTPEISGCRFSIDMMSLPGQYFASKAVKAFRCYKMARRSATGNQAATQYQQLHFVLAVGVPVALATAMEVTNNQRLPTHLKRAPVVYIMLDVANNHTVL